MKIIDSSFTIIW